MLTSIATRVRAGGPRRELALVIKFSAEGVYGVLPVELLKYARLE
jgi:hypothetical protein